MCGIAGFSSFNRTENELKKMTHSLNHRGPDANGIYFDSNVGIGLGHTRLSIIDLSSEYKPNHDISLKKICHGL